jgi:hypothetical protein
VERRNEIEGISSERSEHSSASAASIMSSASEESTMSSRIEDHAPVRELSSASVASITSSASDSEDELFVLREPSEHSVTERSKGTIPSSRA